MNIFDLFGGGNNGYKTISPQQAKQMMNDDVIILDVRTPQEFKERRIPNAILIPDYDIKQKAEKILTDKDKTILVYCLSGGRSAGAARTLVNMGYTNVYNFGGISMWPFETIKG